MADYGPKVREILRRHGCYFERHGKGDHEIWRSVINGRKITVDQKIKSRHTANEILKQAGLSKAF